MRCCPHYSRYDPLQPNDGSCVLQCQALLGGVVRLRVVWRIIVPDAAQVAGVAFAVLVPPAERAVGAVAHRHRHRRQRPVLIPLTLIFPAGVTSITVPLPLIDDGADEPDETVTLAIVPLLNAALDGPVVATLTIPDNDVPATPDPETAPMATPDPETAPTATPDPETAPTATPDPETAPTATPDPETTPTATPDPIVEPGEALD